MYQNMHTSVHRKDKLSAKDAPVHSKLSLIFCKYQVPLKQQHPSFEALFGTKGCASCTNFLATGPNAFCGVALFSCVSGNRQ